ncbi:MAG: hypothetical protein EB059_00160 [Alphaproteobacteria bacterium]|nr:hypothetical protein [Alphaproteobacteria bacterium]
MAMRWVRYQKVILYPPILKTEQYQKMIHIYYHQLFVGITDYQERAAMMNDNKLAFIDMVGCVVISGYYRMR